MPKLATIASPLKGLVLGDSGVGKTGSLWSLADAGFKLKIYDADRGSGILAQVLKSNPEAMARVEVNFYTNKLKAGIGPAKGYSVPDGTPSAWPDVLSDLNKWPDGGGIYEWGPDTVVVVDSLSLLGRHALLHAQYVEKKTGKQPEIQHYGTAQAQMEAMLATLYDDDVKCHVLILTHVSYAQSDIGVMMGFPTALGEKLGPLVPRYFNTMVVVKSAGGKRVLSTKPAAMVQTKVEAFNSVKDEYLLAEGKVSHRGMAEFFADCGHTVKAPK